MFQTKLVEKIKTHVLCAIFFFKRTPFMRLTYSMEQRPSWEPNQFSATKTIPRILWNPEVHYRIYKFSPPLRILSQISPFHAPYYFLKTYLNIIFLSKPGSSKWFLSLRIRYQNPVYTSLLPIVLHS
jgi:hypothetical protein